MMNRFRTYLADTFAISFHETTGVSVLLIILLFCVITPIAYYRFASAPPASTTLSDQAKLDSLVSQMKTAGLADEKNRYANGRKSWNKGSNGEQQSNHFHEIKPFPFDPNTVSVAGWQQLGLPNWLAERIGKYRSKGGTFRKKEDLLRIYDFPPEAYAQLEPYIRLPTSTDRPVDALTKPAGWVATNTPLPDRPRYVKPVVQPFDINTADTTQLIALKGIGSKLASRIIRYRDDLGGFINAGQYTAIYGLDSINLAELTAYARIQSAVRRLPVNTASAADLDRLPFLSRRQAEVIVNYRMQHGPYQTLESLRAVRVLNGGTLEQLAPYLSF